VSKPLHALSEEEVLRELKTDMEGLSRQEAQERIEKFGYNELREERRKTAFDIFLKQFKDIFIILLLAATFFSALIGYYELSAGHAEGFMEAFADTIVITAIVILVAITGFIQEYRAERALEALKKLAAPRARVLRDGKETIIDSREVVPGDILVLETGDHIPADARILESIEIKTNEAVLTGESTPVNKEVTRTDEEAPISERMNMVFTATHVVNGRGKAIVTHTGMGTEFGKIAEMVQTAEQIETPLKRKLDAFAGKLAKVVVAVCVIIFLLEAFEVATQSHFNLEGFIQAFMSAISLAISAVPEGLPAVVTIALALGAREFVKRNAIVRRLSSVESLGAVTVICSDKTGTITKGEMTTRQVWIGDQLIEVTGTGYEPKGRFANEGEEIVLEHELELLLRIGALCNNAKLNRNEVSSQWEIFGDPTEGALIVSAAKAGLEANSLEEAYPRLGELPFTSERRRMTTIHETPEGEVYAYLKGAPEEVLERSASILVGGEELPLSEEKKWEILEVNEQLASNALRVLGMAHKRLPGAPKEYNDKLERELVFVGLQGMIDPPRVESIEANELCQKAGIKTVMITGDHQLTAWAVAKEVGIWREGNMELTGVEMDSLSDEEFDKIVENVTVYARVSPEHKLRIVDALKNKGHIVAMTGDGVNDAPAVKAADIGVAMGITGTDVTKEASDLVLTDDNFATIVKAVEQGRVIYDNIRKYARFLISANFDELLVIGSFAIMGGLFGEKLFPLPLLPAMILWINLMTDGAPAVALSADEPEKDVMERPPRRPEEGILHGMSAFILVSFILESFGTLFIFSLFYYIWPTQPWLSEGMIDEAAREASYRYATTATFLQAAMFELFQAWNCRSETKSIWKMGLTALHNKFFVFSDLLSMLLTVGISYLPLTQQLFQLTPLTMRDLAIVILVGSVGLLVLPEYLMGRKVWRWE
jgi:Ca2+-transporting ATPase